MEDKRTSENDIHSVQSLLFGEHNEHITAAVRKEARAIVTEVITEALDDRQKIDASLVTTIAPLMEKAISKSIESNKASIIDSLYPVLGGLVRKSVAVFFNSFLAKLNYLIEHSLTIKGLRWRIEAWRQGVEFSDYVLKQSLVYRVESVMLIHRPSGTLLCDAQVENSQCNDPVLMSAMLSAINDFMADSFNSQQDVVLESIAAENITLIITCTPHAILAGAVSGTVPKELTYLLQQTLDTIHGNFTDALASFKGDTSAFEQVKPELESCVIAELQPEQASSKAHWLVVTLLIATTLVFGNKAFNTWQQSTLVTAIEALPVPPGVVVQQLEWHEDKLYINYLRDPAAIEFSDWLNSHLASQNPLSEKLLSKQYDPAQLMLIETPFISLAPELINQKVAHLLADTQLTYVIENQNLKLNGTIDRFTFANSMERLKLLPSLSNIDTNDVQVTGVALKNEEKQRLMLDKMLTSLALSSIDFATKSAELTAEMQLVLSELAKQLTSINTLSNSLGVKLGIILTGYSDSTGSKALNLELSQQRASNVKAALILRNVPSDLLFAIGVGELPLTQISNASRKVLVSSITLASSEE
ncbi:OmpA family protein [Thalassotalea euphylliae]|uniref:OmpA family protein n=1 Tax=Thalassotalea euphylliae TaxID=1655234 RepID=A0A3E0UDM2_9GAMM|nr:OmpA family protein [Thalassotalea euphylliae]REL34667.1 OmpA family protein [Thalassotalea euphylliae]